MTPITPDVPALVAAVYEEAPTAERKRLLEQLLRPLGLLSLMAVANGIFARIGLRGHWTPLQLQADDLHHVQASDVAALADYLQQLGVHTFEGLREVLSTSPSLMSSAAAAILLTVLAQHMQRKRTVRDDDLDPP